MINDLDTRMNAIGLGRKEAQIAVFWCKELNKDLECIGSNDQEYRIGDKSSLYKHKQLIKLLGIKSDLWTQELKEDLYDEDISQVTVIVEWKEKSHILFYLKLISESSKEVLAGEHLKLKETIRDYVKEKREQANG